MKVFGRDVVLFVWFGLEIEKKKKKRLWIKYLFKMRTKVTLKKISENGFIYFKVVERLNSWSVLYKKSYMIIWTVNLLEKYKGSLYVHPVKQRATKVVINQIFTFSDFKPTVLLSKRSELNHFLTVVTCQTPFSVFLTGILFARF